MEIVQERLELEFDLELITTAPNVRYRVTTTAGEVLEIGSPSRTPGPGKIAVRAYIRALIMCNDEYVGQLFSLLDESAACSSVLNIRRPSVCCSHTNCRRPRSCSISITA